MKTLVTKESAEVTKHNNTLTFSNPYKTRSNNLLKIISRKTKTDPEKLLIHES